MQRRFLRIGLMKLLRERFLQRLRGQYRWQFTVRGEEIERALPHLPRGRGWSIDVDPVM